MARRAAWRDYQDQVAQFFRSSGMDAKVEGARARHDVDVLVEFEKLGIRHRWVVECKPWKRRIPKERVLTLQGVVSDIGGDRGFLLCEVGFQSGAIRRFDFAAHSDEGLVGCDRRG
jgi:restriction system protein